MPLESWKSVTDFSVLSFGAAVSGVSVGSLGSSGVLGSSDGSVGRFGALGSVQLWLATLLTPAGSGLLIVTLKVMTAVPSLPPLFPGTVMPVTETEVLPAPLPSTTVPLVLVTEPTTSVVLGSGVSVKLRSVAAMLPLL